MKGIVMADDPNDVDTLIDLDAGSKRVAPKVSEQKIVKVVPDPYVDELCKGFGDDEKPNAKIEVKVWIHKIKENKLEQHDVDPSTLTSEYVKYDSKSHASVDRKLLVKLTFESRDQAIEVAKKVLKK